MKIARWLPLRFAAVFLLAMIFSNFALAGQTAKPLEKNVLSTELATVAGQDYRLVFSGDGDACAFDRLTIFNGKKELALFEHRCGQKTELASKNDEAFVIKRGKFGRVVKLGPTDDDVYLLLREKFSEVDSSPASHAVLIHLGPVPALTADLSPEGTFKDDNADGLLDHLVEGGKGARRGSGSVYDPFQVALQKKSAGKISFIYDEDLSKKYSLESDYLWHGPKSDPAVVVDARGKRLPQ